MATILDTPAAEVGLIDPRHRSPFASFAKRFVNVEPDGELALRCLCGAYDRGETDQAHPCEACRGGGIVATDPLAVALHDLWLLAIRAEGESLADQAFAVKVKPIYDLALAAAEEVLGERAALVRGGWVDSADRAAKVG